MSTLHLRRCLVTANINKWYAKTAKTGGIPQANHHWVDINSLGKSHPRSTHYRPKTDSRDMLLGFYFDPWPTGVEPSTTIDDILRT